MENEMFKSASKDWTPIEKAIAKWFLGSVAGMLLFMVISMLPGFIGGFSVVVSIVALISTIASVICLMVYEINGKDWP